MLNADRGTVQTRRSYLLRGILTCECGGLMAGNSGRPGAVRYTCKPYSEEVADRVGNRGGCGASIAADFVEQFVTEWSISALDAPGLTDAVRAETEVDRAEIVRLTAENAIDRNAFAEFSDDYYVHRVIPDKATFVRLSRAERTNRRTRVTTGIHPGHLHIGPICRPCPGGVAHRRSRYSAVHHLRADRVGGCQAGNNPWPGRAHTRSFGSSMAV